MNPRHPAIHQIVKRSFDLALAGTLLVAMAFPMAMIAWLVRMTSPGPALYWSNRVGRNNEIFSMPKFRSMRTETPEVATHKLSNTDRWITPIGRFLRKTSLDELPQLWTILTGHMSFVGPRPALHNQDDLIAMRTAVDVHKLTPGLTGWAQVNGRDELSLSQKVAYDAQYHEGQSLLWDLQILAMTFVRVLHSDGVQQTGDQAPSETTRRAA